MRHTPQTEVHVVGYLSGLPTPPSRDEIDMPDDKQFPTLDPSRDQHRDSVLDDMLTVAEVATWLKVSRSWIYERTRTRGPDRLPHIKLGKYLRFDPQAIRAFLIRNAHGP